MIGRGELQRLQRFLQALKFYSKRNFRRVRARQSKKLRAPRRKERAIRLSLLKNEIPESVRKLKAPIGSEQKSELKIKQ